MEWRRSRGRIVWLGIVLMIAVGLVAGIRPFMRFLYPLHYRQTVEKYAKNHRLDPLLITAVMDVESGFNPRAISVRGARGLMQLMPETAAWCAEQMGLEEYRSESLFDPEQNLRIGIWYLATLRRLFDGQTVLALAAYNGGRANVLRWLSEESWSGAVEEVGDIPFPETRAYVRKVLKSYTWYRRIWGNTPLFSSIHPLE